LILFRLIHFINVQAMKRIVKCAEKYLKALLSEAGIFFGKIHDLIRLLDAVIPNKPALEAYQRQLAYLSEFAVACRYPGESADKDYGSTGN